MYDTSATPAISPSVANTVGTVGTAATVVGVAAAAVGTVATAVGTAVDAVHAVVGTATAANAHNDIAVEIYAGSDDTVDKVWVSAE